MRYGRVVQGTMGSMIRGTLVAESLRLHEDLVGVPLTVGRIVRAGPLEGLTEAQPPVWTFVEFAAADEHAEELAQLLSRIIDSDLGWYCDFHTDAETFVVFSGAVFRYPRGDVEGRARAVAHAREVGLPAAQADWPE
jgi:hypothetical protein